jgi:hypothetical protein
VVFFPKLGFFAGFSMLYISLLSPVGIAELLWAGRGARSGPFLPVIELQKMNARSARAHTDFYSGIVYPSR